MMLREDVFLGIGTNLGDREANIRCCLQYLKDQVGEMVCYSSFFYSEPMGFVSEHTFANVAVHLRTALSPLALLQATQQIEQSMGRTQKSTLSPDGKPIYHDRIIDIDILYYGTLQQTFYDAQGKPILILPHPHIAERDFVRVPLSEIRSDPSLT